MDYQNHPGCPKHNTELYNLGLQSKNMAAAHSVRRAAKEAKMDYGNNLKL